MAKKQATAVKLPFVLVDSVTSTGKPCIFWDKKQSQSMAREDFLSLRHEVALLGGFMFQKQGNPAFCGVSREDLTSLLKGKTWAENTPKETKKVKQVPAMDAETAKMFAMFQAFMKASGK